MYNTVARPDFLAYFYLKVRHDRVLWLMQLIQRGANKQTTVMKVILLLYVTAEIPTWQKNKTLQIK